MILAGASITSSGSCRSGFFLLLGCFFHRVRLDVRCINPDCRPVYRSEEALDVLFRLGLCAVPVHSVWNCARDLHHHHPESDIGEGDPQAEANVTTERGLIEDLRTKLREPLKVPE
jgi:hypothetical protein